MVAANKNMFFCFSYELYVSVPLFINLTKLFIFYNLIYIAAGDVLQFLDRGLKVLFLKTNQGVGLL